MYPRLLKLKKINDERKKSPGSMVYQMRMYDLILNNKQPTLNTKQKETPEGFMEMILEILNKFTGNENKNNRLNSNINILSPRLVPIMPNKAQSSTLQLSPTLFALYDNEEAEEEEKEKNEIENNNFLNIKNKKNNQIPQNNSNKKQNQIINDGINNIASISSVILIKIFLLILKKNKRKLNG